MHLFDECSCLKIMILNSHSLEFVHCSKASDQKIFYNNYYDFIFSITFRILGNTNDAQDALQETFLKIFKTKSPFKNEGSLEGWLRRIATNTSINILKSKKIKFADLEAVNEIPESESAAYKKIESDEVNFLLLNLSKQNRVIFTLHAFEGYSLKEISILLNINESACRCRYLRARAKLYKIWMLGIAENKKEKNTQRHIQRIA